MTPNNDFQRLYKIIKSSSRVREARHMFGLQEGEFIIQFTDNDTRTTIADGPTGRHVSEGSGDVAYFYSTTEGWVQKHILEHFRLSLDVETVLRAIFFQRDYVPPTTFHSRTRINADGNFEIVVEFFEAPNAASRKELQEVMSKQLELLEGLHATSNTAGLQTRLPPYERVKSLQDFDARFELTKSYKEICMRHPERSDERKIALEQLVQKAASMLGKDERTGYNAENLYKLVNEFEDYFGVVTVD